MLKGLLEVPLNVTVVILLKYNIKLLKDEFFKNVQCEIQNLF